ncbi:MAG: polysaccharide deacetylase family protein [Verrucomicrobiae bacterium]|nr:polysaccharide deacetylase family protein [Verrucomicrobiae bacterium]
MIVRSAPNLGSDEAAENLAAMLSKMGVRKVWIQCKQDETDEFEGGLLYFPGESAPVVPGFEDGRLLRFAKSLKDQGLQVFAWVPCFHDPHAWEEHPGWRSRMVDEEKENVEMRNWLCPRHPGAVAHESEILAEAIVYFGGVLDGVYTDFIRFDNDFSCVCERCLAEYSKRIGGGMVISSDITEAWEEMGDEWEIWTDCRGDAIREALDAMRERIDEASPDLWFGAAVLPFSAVDYSMNTQSGQDLGKMCQAGVDEIFLMGYWDDWGKSKEWLAESLIMAKEQAGDDARVSVLLDADMSERATRATLNAIGPDARGSGWFLYDVWDKDRLNRLHRSYHPPAPQVSQYSWETTVTVRIDTEPDHLKDYSGVNPGMIIKLLDLFREEEIQATFVTCARLAEIQGEILKRAEREGHEIAVHAYDHEQIDELTEDEQIRVVDLSTEVMRRLGFSPSGFGAPRNSITQASRNRLIERGYFYDGSDAFDPMLSTMEPYLVEHESGDGRGIVVVPFVVPNDWDALFVEGLTREQMLEEWTKRLDKMVDEKQPCFVLDIHQWIASRPGDIDVLRDFIRYAKSKSGVRFETLHGAAEHALAYLGVPHS